MRNWKWLLLGLIAVVLARVEHTGTPINQLEPVETVLLTQNNGSIIIETDTGAKGIGNNLDKAIENLQSCTSAQIFLDTAQYLLVSSRTQSMLPQMRAYIRPAARVCIIRGDAELSEVTEYLRTHPPRTQLRELTAEEQLQVLYYQEGRGQLAG